MLTIDGCREFTAKLGKPFELHKPIYDAMEGWTIVFSVKSIKPEDYLDGYRRLAHSPEVYTSGIDTGLGTVRVIANITADALPDAPYSMGQPLSSATFDNLLAGKKEIEKPELSRATGLFSGNHAEKSNHLKLLLAK